MSKAAELTREELAGRLANLIYMRAEILEDEEDGPRLENSFEIAEAVLAELKALGLVLVPEVPTEEMMVAIGDTIYAADGDGGIANHARVARDAWPKVIAALPLRR